MLISGNFINIHHKEWVTYCGRANGPGEVCYDFLYAMILLKLLISLLWFWTLILIAYFFFDLVLPSNPKVILHWPFLHWEILVIVEILLEWIKSFKFVSWSTNINRVLFKKRFTNNKKGSFLTFYTSTRPYLKLKQPVNANPVFVCFNKNIKNKYNA